MIETLRRLTRSSTLRILLLLAAAAAQPTLAQAPDTKTAAQALMQNVGALVGEWEGEGWSRGHDGSRQPTKVHERVQWKLDETALLIEGRGTNEAGEVAHDAMAVLYFDLATGTYAMHSHLANGMSVRPYFEVVEPNARFQWGFELPSGEIRYAITLSEDGSLWSEIGEFSQDGEDWVQILEMQLTRQ